MKKVKYYITVETIFSGVIDVEDDVFNAIKKEDDGAIEKFICENLDVTSPVSLDEIYVEEFEEEA